MASSKLTPTVPHPGGTIHADILHLIIDLIAESEPTTCAQLLRTFSFVSKRFHCQARKHLFSHIRFQFSDDIRERDRRLFRFLTKLRNEYLHSSIRSVTIVLGPVTPSPLNGLHGMSTPVILSVARPQCSQSSADSYYDLRATSSSPVSSTSSQDCSRYYHFLLRPIPPP